MTRRLPTTHTGPLHLDAGETLAFDLASGGHWYGHGFSHVQPYPLETGSIVNPAFAVNNIQCPVWMASKGIVVFAETRAMLDVRLNENSNGQLAVCCPHEPLTVHVFRGADLPAAHAQWLRHVGWPNRPPPAAVFGDAVFCTWTQYPRCLTQERVLDMARQIRAHAYPCRTLVIDDRWESCFGELTFASRDFPDPAGMLAELHRLDFRVWLWVTPFVNVEAAGFDQLARDGVLVRRRDGAGAARLKWWGGTAGLVDVTGTAGRGWYRTKLEALQALGADGFKVDGGDFKYQPSAMDAVWAKPPGASGYSDALLALFDELVPNACETRTAWLSQRRSILWREGGKDSHWGIDNGLAALVTLGLHLGLLGYDILMPDMIPGRVQTMDSQMALPTDELMVRWTETTAFMPLMQFSYFPWNYAAPTASVVRQFALVHQALQDYLAATATARTEPLLRPLWYSEPANETLYTVADEWLLGRDLLVAPVLTPEATQRTVVLPAGYWRDAWTGREFRSGTLTQFPAPCPGIPVFVRAENAALLEKLRAALRNITRGTVPSGVTTSRHQCGLDRDLNVTG